MPEKTRVSPLRKARMDKRMTLEEVAESTGLDVATISRLERGRQWPTRRTYVLTEFFPDLTINQLADPFGELSAGDEAQE